MGYSIQYDTGGVVKVQKRKERKRRKWMLPVLVAMGITALTLFTNFRQLLWDMFLPGATESTELAFSQMITDLRSGDSIREAVSTFCMEILENAQAEN